MWGSIITPFLNEEANIPSLIAEVRRAAPDAEIIAVDDASSDGTLKALKAQTGVKVFSYPKNLGQSAALYLGLSRTSGDLLVMLDGDGQNDSADIPTLLAALTDGRADAAFGYRKRRHDSLSKKITSRLGNGIRRRVLGDALIDTGCSLKAFRREHLRFLVPFNGMHRYFGVFFARAGLTVAQVPVNHRARAHGVSHYTNLGRAWRGLRDLVGVSWLMARRLHWHAETEIVRHG
jgi:dolichol-phosphate mannosyltransferase